MTRLPTMQEFWLTRAEKAGGVPFDMWRPACERLLAAGMLNDKGELTAAGRAALEADRERADEVAMRANVLPMLSGEPMALLGKLIREEALTSTEERSLSRIELAGALERGPSGFYVTSFGRKAYAMATEKAA